MADYITGAELVAFTNITSLAAAAPATLEANIILRTKLMIDQHCFKDFEDADESTDDYAKIQLAQKLMSERLWIKDNQDPKQARTILGKGGSETKGDWKYSIGEEEPIINKEIEGLLADLRDWSKAKTGRPVTGKMALKGDRYYDSKVNSNDQNTI